MNRIKEQIFDSNWVDFSDEHYAQTYLALWLHLRDMLRDSLQDRLWDNVRDHIWLQITDDARGQ